MEMSADQSIAGRHGLRLQASASPRFPGGQCGDHARWCLSRNALRRGGKVKERIRLQNCIWRASSNFGELFFLEAAVSHSFFSADRPTHFKIVAIAVACSVAVTLFCLTA